MCFLNMWTSTVVQLHDSSEESDVDKRQSYIPGGVVSGTALIRPDFPELLTFPFLWQQVEYVMGGGSSHYMFLVLAAQQLLSNR